MSKRRDRERAKQFLYRNGVKVPRELWDKNQRELREVAEAQRLKRLGLFQGKPDLLVATRTGLEKGKKPIMTLAEIEQERRALRR